MHHHVVAYKVVHVGPHTDTPSEGIGPISVLNSDGQHVSL